MKIGVGEIKGPDGGRGTQCHQLLLNLQCAGKAPANVLLLSFPLSPNQERCNLVIRQLTSLLPIIFC